MLWPRRCVQVLRHGGYHPDRIVVMVADDIANAPNNPHPGKIFNRPGEHLEDGNKAGRGGRIRCKALRRHYVLCRMACVFRAILHMWVNPRGSNRHVFQVQKSVFMFQ